MSALAVRHQPFPEHELPQPFRAAFTECQQVQSQGATWLGSGSGRRLVLPSGVTFFPVPVGISFALIIMALTGGFIGVVAMGMGVVSAFTQGPQGLITSIVVGVFGLFMLVTSVVLVRYATRQKRAALASVQVFGLYAFPTALVYRRPASGVAGQPFGWCELYPRPLVRAEAWQGWGGAGTSSQSSGSSSRCLRLTWTNPDGSAGDRVLGDWRFANEYDEELLRAL